MLVGSCRGRRGCLVWGSFCHLARREACRGSFCHLMQEGCALLCSWPLDRGVMWIHSSCLFVGFCHGMADSVQMVMDNLSLMLCPGLWH